MWAAQTRQPKPMLTTRKGLTSNHSFELEWSRALLAEQKCCCPQRHHVCDLWPQKPFSQSGLKGKEMKWCKKTPNPICSSWCQVHGVLTLGLSLTSPPGRTQRLQLWYIITFACAPAFLQLCCWSQ